MQYYLKCSALPIYVCISINLRFSYATLLILGGVYMSCIFTVKENKFRFGFMSLLDNILLAFVCVECFLWCNLAFGNLESKPLMVVLLSAYDHCLHLGDSRIIMSCPLGITSI